MNVHVRRVEARRRANRLDRFLAACLTALFVGLFIGRAAHAQDAGTVVAACGNTAVPYAVGATRPFQVDQFGNLCSTGNSIANGSGNAGYVTNAVPKTVSSSGTTGAVTATLPGTAGLFTYICGLEISVLQGGTTAATAGPFTVTGTQQTLTFQQASLAVNTALNFQQSFSPCLPASANNTGISVTTTADAGAAAVNVNVWGFQQ